MLKITSVTMKNFLSVGNITQAVNLNENGLTLILGSNTDATGGSRNGAGKSTIAQAISYGLYGKPITKIKIPNLVNNINTKGMLVTIDFEENGISYRVERGKKPDVMKFYKNSEEQHLDTEDETKGENKHTQQEIDRIIGMSHTMFKHIVALTTFTDPFLKLGAADQRMIIEELLGVTQISQRADVLKKLILVTKDIIREHEASIRATTESNGRIEQAIRNAEVKAQAWENAHNAKLEGLADELATMENTDFHAEVTVFDTIDAYDNDRRNIETEQTLLSREVSHLITQADALSNEINRLLETAKQGSQTQLARLHEELKRKLDGNVRTLKKKQTAIEAVAQARDDISNADGNDCVCCGQSIAGTEHLATIIESLNGKIREHTDEIERLNNEITVRTQEADDISQEISRIEIEDRNRATEIENQIATKREEETQQRSLINQKNDILLQHSDTIKALGNRPTSRFANRDEVYRARSERETIERTLEHEIKQENPNTSHIEEYRKTLQVLDYTALNEATDLLKHQDFLMKLLTSKDSFIRKKIVDQNLAYLNSRLNYYLDKIGLPHEVAFQSDLTVSIQQLGRDTDFEQLSRGEMNRVIMATSWSFRDVWESQNNSINLGFYDEILDNGLCQQGVESALGVLKSMARDRAKNIFLISHREELQSRIDHTLLVEKDNGFTTIQPV